MPVAKRAATLNLGMQTVTLAVFESSGDSGLVLSGFARSELLPDPAIDSSRPGQLKIAIAELRGKLKPGGVPCAVAIPSQGVFTRFVKIPKVEPDQASQMLFFEAQQNVPYPIEEVSWCYQVLPESEPDKLGAVILATKLDQLESTVEAVRSAGFSPKIIETAPTALYNALRYNYPDLTGCALLIDIGARATNLIFAEGDRLFVRTLPVGGNSITAALQKKFEDRPLPVVEEMKVKAGFIAPPGNYDASDDEAAEMGKIARTVMTRIHNEITRSITFYRTSQQGSAPTRVFLSGGGASLPYTLEFFNEKLSLPIEFFNPLRRVSVAPSADKDAVQRSVHTLGECVGMAARLLLGDCPLQVNLESRRLLDEKREERRRPFLAAGVFLLAAILGAVFLHFKGAADNLAALNADLDTRVAELKGFKQQMDQTSADRNRLFEEAADLAAAPMLRTAWAAILDDLSQRMPARNVWITRLSPMAGQTVLDPRTNEGGWQAAQPDDEGGQPAVTALVVEGLYLENEAGPAVVDEFVDSLSQSTVFAIDPAKKTEVVQLRAAQSGENWAYDYKLVLPLRRPITL
jgi:type IV pilus assembly protein PilM